MMNVAETGQVLRRLAGGTLSNAPRIEDREAAVDEWSRSLSGFDFSVALAAAEGWIENEDRWPTLNQFLDAVQAQNRAHVIQRALASAPMGPAEMRRAGKIARTIAEMIRSPLPGDAMRQEFVLRLREQGIDEPTGLSPIRNCDTCNDDGMVEYVQPGRADNVRPCPDCNEAGVERWSGSHYEPGHSCGDCDALRGRVRRGRRSAEHPGQAAAGPARSV